MSSSSDWDEIRRLASDLQRAQLSTASQRLSERNCVEIVMRLSAMGLIDVVFTADGKEYVTPQQLQREIRDELFVNRGRVSLVDLASGLDVDYSHVEAQAETVCRQDSGVTLILGQLVSTAYLDFMAEEINEKLQLEGTVSVSTVTKEYDLPADFLAEEITKRLGSLIEGYRDTHDPKTIVTPAYVARNRARVRGTLSAITVPTPVSAIVNNLKIQEQLFFSLAEELIKTKRVAGSLSGGRKANKATYTPAAYSRAQATYVDDFFAQNGYLDYDAVRRLGVAEPEAFAKRRFAGQDMIFLGTCCVGAQVCAAVEASVDEALSLGTWLDVAPLLPSALSTDDANAVLKRILERKAKAAASARTKSPMILADTVLLTHDMLERVETSFTALVTEQATADIASKKYEKMLSASAGADKFVGEEDSAADRKEERRKKAAGGKTGGGTQGRETKTKSTKKKYGKPKKGADNDSDASDASDHEDSSSASKAKFEFLSQKNLATKLSENSLLSDVPEEALAELARHLAPSLNAKLKATVTELFAASLLASTHDRRKALSALQERTASAVNMIRLFEKGLSAFDSSDRKPLEKHLLKTLCADAVNDIFVFVREEKGLAVGAGETLTPEQRLKLLSELAKDAAEPLHAMHKALAAADVAVFLEEFERSAPVAVDLMLRKPDKKRDRQLVFGHRQDLLEQMDKATEPALVLHLAALALFASQKNALVHASGKFVPAILNAVKTGLAEDQSALLERYAVLVMQEAAAGADQAKKTEIRTELEANIAAVKEVAASAKKNAKAEQD